MIADSDKLYHRILWLLATSDGKNVIGVVRALSKALNVALKAVKEEDQAVALQLAKSEIEHGVDAAGGLIEVLKEIIASQAIRISELETLHGEDDDRTVQ